MNGNGNTPGMEYGHLTVDGRWVGDGRYGADGVEKIPYPGEDALPEPGLPEDEWEEDAEEEVGNE